VENKLKQIAEDTWLTQVRNYVPSAWIGHAPFLRFLIRELKPRVFVELGTHNGFSYFVACQTVQELGLPTKTYAIDHWGGDKHAGIFDETVYESAKALNEQYKSFSTLVKMTFLEARSFVPNEIDLLHIDGLHTYDAVKEDFETWLPKMNSNGVILLHDIHVRHADFGVYRLWEEIKSVYSTIEFVGSYGLGVIFLGSIPDNSLRLVKEIADKGNLMQIQGVFGGLSDGVIQNYRLIVESSINMELNEVNRDVEKLEIEIIKYKANFDSISNQLEAIRDSTSWKLTLPLRKVVSILKVRRK
jgi:hypothetical protein